MVRLARRAVEERRRKAAVERRERFERLRRERNSLWEELAGLRGLFTAKRRKEIEARLSEIDRELSRQE